jgi:hypothetical protein
MVRAVENALYICVQAMTVPQTAAVQIYHETALTVRRANQMIK